MIIVQAEVLHLRDKYPPLRGEPWHRREEGTTMASGTKRVLQRFSIKDTLPALLEHLLGAEEEGGAGLDEDQVRGVICL